MYLMVFVLLNQPKKDLQFIDTPRSEPASASAAVGWGPGCGRSAAVAKRRGSGAAGSDSSASLLGLPR